jgi:hypothetical protein
MNKKRRKKKPVLSKRELEIKNFNKFMNSRGFAQKIRGPENLEWVTFVQGGSPGLGK